VGLIAGAADFTVCLEDGRRIVVPYACYPRLDHADRIGRAHFEVHADGRMLHWPDLDEDIEVQHIIEGRMPVKMGREFPAVADGPAVYGAPPQASAKAGGRKARGSGA
jgi:hypothetical protein